MTSIKVAPIQPGKLTVIHLGSHFEILRPAFFTQKPIYSRVGEQLGAMVATGKLEYGNSAEVTVKNRTFRGKWNNGILKALTHSMHFEVSETTPDRPFDPNAPKTLVVDRFAFRNWLGRQSVGFHTKFA